MLLQRLLQRQKLKPLAGVAAEAVARVLAKGQQRSKPKSLRRVQGGLRKQTLQSHLAPKERDEGRERTRQFQQDQHRSRRRRRSSLLGRELHKVRVKRRARSPSRPQKPMW